MTEKFGTFSGR